MDVRVCQHVPAEGPAAVADWALARGHDLAVTRLDRGEHLPEPCGPDLLVVLGGPMGVDDVQAHSWLRSERALISDVLGDGGAVVGICLGAQQLASTLGAPVRAHDHQMIGWHPVRATPAADDTLFAVLPESYPAFHWHGDRFGLPESATHTARSEGCRTQAFVAREGRAVGLQFHLEATPDSVETLVEAYGVPEGGPWVQDRETILAEDAPYDELRSSLFALLDEVAARAR